MPLTNVKPAGSVSVTVTVPVVATAPPLVTDNVYCAPCWPCVKLAPTCALLIVRSGNWVTVMASTFDVLLAVLLSVHVQATTAVLVMLAAALAATFTFSVITEVALVASGVAALTQVTSCPAALHVHPVPVPLTNVRPAGSVSVTVMVPVVGPFAVLLVTVIVNCAPSCPCAKFPTCVLAIVKSGRALMTISLFAPNEPAAPGAGNVRTA